MNFIHKGITFTRVADCQFQFFNPVTGQNERVEADGNGDLARIANNVTRDVEAIRYRTEEVPNGFSDDVIPEDANMGWLWLDWHLLKWLHIEADPDQEPNAYTRGWLMGFFNAGGRLAKPVSSEAAK